jgi:DNA polymerase III alpha subunit
MSLEEKLAQSIAEIRNSDGEFRYLNDFILRVDPGLEQIVILIRSGAFRFTGKKKAVLLWKAHMMMNKSKPEPTRPLFSSPVKNFSLPDLKQCNLEDAYDEIELLGFPVSMSWFDMLKTSFRGDVRAVELINYKGKKIRMVGHLVTIKYIKTIKKIG